MSQRARAPGLLRDRSTLLGTPPISGRSSPFDGIQVNGHRYADDLEGQNDEALEGLSSKVKQLKDVTHNWYWQRGPGVNDTAKPDERCLRRDGVNSLWNFSKNEQHGFKAGLPLVVVYCFSRRCVLVLYCNLVVSTMTTPCLLHQKLQLIYQDSTHKQDSRTKIITRMYSRVLKGKKNMGEIVTRRY